MMKLTAFAITCALIGLGSYIVWSSTRTSATTPSNAIDANSAIANVSTNAPDDASADHASRAADDARAGAQTATGSDSSAHAAQTATPPPAKQPAPKVAHEDQACLKKETAICQQTLARVNVAAAQCSQAARQGEYATDQERGVVRQGGVYGGMSCGRDSDFYFPRCIADARKKCGFKPEMTAVQQRIEKLRQMGAK